MAQHYLSSPSQVPITEKYFILRHLPMVFLLQHESRILTSVLSAEAKTTFDILFIVY